MFERAPNVVFQCEGGPNVILVMLNLWKSPPEQTDLSHLVHREIQKHRLPMEMSTVTDRPYVPVLSAGKLRQKCHIRSTVSIVSA